MPLTYEPSEPAGDRTEETERFAQTLLSKLAYAIGKDAANATRRDWYMATALAVRDRIVDCWFASTRRAYTARSKRVYYLSIEFLLGRLLGDSLNALGLTDVAEKALASFGVDLQAVRQSEPDAGLGNGGLGRLAACVLESMASLGIPGHGYGIRYDHGVFRQKFDDGWQSEIPEEWLRSRTHKRDSQIAGSLIQSSKDGG